VRTTTLNVVIGGEAGQGIVTLGGLLCKSLVRCGYSVVVTQSYQSRIRGGHNTFAIRVSSEDIAAPSESIGFLVALNVETVSLHREELSAHGIVLADAAFELEPFDRLVAVPFSEFGKARFANVAALGVVGAILGLDQKVIERAIRDAFDAQHPELVEENQAVVGRAFSWAATRNPPVKKLPPAANPPHSRMMVNGNEAIAMGALSAGVRFCAFYPMTPATSISLTLIRHAKEMGVMVEQVEDEIAAINMALGASYAGGPSMTATSGGGLALMAEGVSLAAQTETPIVIVVAQRPGPATGLPTRTEQADLEFVLHLGHGEFPRAVLAPGTTEECFYLTRKAFTLAEEYQGPVFILTDQFLADSYRAVTPFDIGKLEPVQPGADPAEVSTPYRRFELTEDGVSPRLIPGTSDHIVAVDSDEHTQDGRLTEDLEVRVQMVEKRMKKEDGLRAETISPEFEGDENPDLLLVGWGSSKGALTEATGHLREQGIRVGVMHFSQVWPLVTGQFLGRLESAGKVVCVEGNALGQLARLIRRESGFEFHSHVRRYDGLPLTPEYIVDHIGRKGE